MSDQHEQQVYGGQYNAGGNIHINNYSSSRQQQEAPQAVQKALATLTLEGDVRQFTEKEREKFIWCLAQLLNISEEQIRILRVTEGSIKVELTLPEEAARRLAEMQKNDDPVLQQLPKKVLDVEICTYKDALITSLQAGKNLALVFALARDLHRISANDIDYNIASALARANDLANNIANTLEDINDITFYIVLHRVIDRIRDINHDLHNTRNLNNDNIRVHNLVNYLAFARDLISHLAPVRVRNLVLSSFTALDRTSFSALDHAFDRALDREHNLVNVIKRDLEQAIIRVNGLANDLNLLGDLDLLGNLASVSNLDLINDLDSANDLANDLFAILLNIGETGLGTDHVSLVEFKQAVQEFNPSLLNREEKN